MQTYSMLLNLAWGRSVNLGESRAQRMQIIIGGLLSALVLAVFWGWAAGSRDWALVLANTYKMPLIVMASALISLPAGLLALKLSNAPYRSSELMASYSSGLLSGTLVLAVLAPLLALYYNTSAFAGPILAEGSVGLAILVGALIFLRGVMQRSKDGPKNWQVWIPVLVVLVLQAIAIFQLIALVSPILPDTTLFTQGIDSVVNN